MVHVEAFIKVKNDRDKCYEFIKKNISRFPTFIPNIKKLNQVYQLSHDRIITEWEVDLGGALVKWKEEDVFNDKSYSISFHMVEGDFIKYEGKWQFDFESTKTTRICVSALFDWGIPNLGKHVGPVLEKKAKLNFKSMLLAIKKQLDKNEF